MKNKYYDYPILNCMDVPFDKFRMFSSFFVLLCLPIIDFKRLRMKHRQGYGMMKFEKHHTCICVLHGLYLIHLKIDVCYISQYSKYINTEK